MYLLILDCFLFTVFFFYESGALLFCCPGLQHCKVSAATYRSNNTHSGTVTSYTSIRVTNCGRKRTCVLELNWFFSSNRITWLPLFPIQCITISFVQDQFTGTLLTSPTDTTWEILRDHTHVHTHTHYTTLFIYVLFILLLHSHTSTKYVIRFKSPQHKY